MMVGGGGEIRLEIQLGGRMVRTFDGLDDGLKRREKKINFRFWICKEDGWH